MEKGLLFDPTYKNDVAAVVKLFVHAMNVIEIYAFSGFRDGLIKACSEVFNEGFGRCLGRACKLIKTWLYSANGHALKPLTG